jgi:3-hydroxyacyl-CoA dehydrogenase
MRLQTLGTRLGEAPVVAAIHGYALGGGLELAMNCRKVVASAEATIGLPESKVGLLPGGRGVTIMRMRTQQSPQMAREAVVNLTEGFVASNAVEAKIHGYLAEHDEICFNPDLLITQAKEAALRAMPRPAIEFKPVAPHVNGLIEEATTAKLKDGTLTAYDEFLSSQLRFIFAKSTSVENAESLERERFIQLCQRPETRARIAHMLEYGKPIKN